MSETAYVFITVVGREISYVLNKVQSIEGVKIADAVTGPYDIILTITAANMDGLTKLITGKIHKVDGIERTLTCIVLEL